MASLVCFPCGDTTHGIHQLVRGAPRERRVFPAGVFLYDDGVRRVLFDTGYAARPWRAGLAGAAYRRLLPPRIPAGSTAGERIDPATVTHVVLSHLHPDHVGGLRAFPDAAVVVTPELRDSVRALVGGSGGVARDRPRLRDGILRGLLPDGLVDRLVAPALDTEALGFRAADLFGDGSYLLLDLPGHARGHAGALVDGRALLAGDAAWARDLLGREAHIRALPRSIAHDFDRQAATAAGLLAAERSGVRLLFSHDPHPEGGDLLAGPAGARDDRPTPGGS